MKKAKFTFPVLLVAALFAATLLAGCGGGSSGGLKSSDVAVVGKVHIDKTAFNALLAQAQQSYAQQQPPRAFPKAGTSGYESVKSQAVTLLVQQAEREAKAQTLGITITDKAVQTRLNQIKKQYFGNSEKKYQAQLKSQGLNDAQVRVDIRSQLISEAVFAKVTATVTVSAGAVHQYYVTHPQLYSQPQTRDVRHILVKTKPLAESIYAQLKAGNDKTWCTLAKKYSQDPSSKDKCGDLTVSKGQTVPEFDKVVFSQPTKQIHAPVHNAQYGWFTIESLDNIKPRATTPEKQVSAAIKQQLLQTDKNQTMTDWVSSLTKSFCSGSQIKYQVGYSPTPDPCTPPTTTTNATTTG
jgi:peptidyl-prolyl cis-trans isomerase C